MSYLHAQGLGYAQWDFRIFFSPLNSKIHAIWHTIFKENVGGGGAHVAADDVSRATDVQKEKRAKP